MNSDTGSEASDGLPPDRRLFAMLSVGIAVSMAVLDGSIANVALPTIAQQMHATPASAIWVVNSYQLAVTISLLPLASLGDIYGHRRVYCWGVLLYTLASIGCALSTSLPELVTGRVIQGFGGAGIMSVNGALIRFIFPRSQLGRGIGYNVLIVGTSSAAGPSVAAAVMAAASWPWLFAIQVPFGIVALTMSLRYLPHTPKSRHPFDVQSAVLNAVTLGLFIIGLDGIGHGEQRGLVAVELIGCVLVGYVFVRRQLHLHPPMLPIDLLIQRPIFALSVATATCTHAAAIIGLVVLPFYFQYAGGLTPVQIGAVMTPWPAAVVGTGADRWPPGGSLFGWHPRRPRPDGHGHRAGVGDADASHRGLARHRVAPDPVRRRLRPVSITQQPPAPRQRPAREGRRRQRHAVDLTPGRPDDRQRHRRDGPRPDPRRTQLDRACNPHRHRHRRRIGNPGDGPELAAGRRPVADLHVDSKKTAGSANPRIGSDGLTAFHGQKN